MREAIDSLDMTLKRALRFVASCALSLAAFTSAAAPAPGTVISNQATATAQAGAAALTSQSGVVTAVVSAAPIAPVVTKAFGAAAIAAGGATSLTFTIRNPNPATVTANVTGIAFSDVFPTSPGAMTVADSAISNTCTGSTWEGRTGAGPYGAPATGNTEVRLSGLTLASGASCTVSVNVTATAVGSYSNTTSAITATGPSAITGAASNTAVLAVSAGPVVTKRFGAAILAAGATTSLTITVQNSGSFPLTGVSFTDTYPTGPAPIANSSAPNPAASPAACTGTLVAAPNGNSFALTGGTIPANTTCAYSVQVLGTNPGINTNTTGAVTSANAPASAPATATIGVRVPPTVSKAFTPASIPAGGTSVLTLAIANPSTNAGATTGIVLADTFPAGLTLADSNFTFSPAACGTASATGTGGLTVTVATLVPGASCEVRANVTSSTAGAAVNTTAPVTASGPVALTGGTATATLTVSGVTAPQVSKSFAPANILVGGRSVLALVVTNPAANAAAFTGLQLGDTFPAGLTLVDSVFTFSPAACGSASAAGLNGLTLTVASLAPGASCEVRANVTSSTAGTAVNTTAAVTAAGPVALTGATATATLTVTGVAAPAVSKSFAPASILVGGSSVLTLAVTNPAANAAALTGIQLGDTFPAGLTLADSTFTFSPAACGSASAAGSNGLTLTVASLASGASCEVRASVTSRTVGAAVNTTAAVTAAGPVAVTGATATATLTVTGAPPPGVAKSFASNVIALGDRTMLAIAVTNPGATALTGVAFNDAYPSNITNSAAATPRATPAACTGTLTAPANGTSFAVNGATVPANTTCTYSVEVVGSSAGTMTNSTGPVTSVSAPDGAAATATLSVYAPPAVSKAFAPTHIAIGGSSVLTITIRNPNPPSNTASLTGISVTDVLPTSPAAMTVFSGSTNCPGSTWTGVLGAADVRLTGVSLASGASCTVTVAVVAPLAGVYSNTTGAIEATGPLRLAGLPSNTAVLSVAQPEARMSAVLAPNNQVDSEPGATLLFRHTLTNTGDTADEYTFTTSDLGIGGWSFASAALFADADDDGRPDSATPIGGRHRLNPGQVLRFLARVVVPAAPLKTQNDLRIVATSAGGAVIAPVIDRVVLPDRAAPPKDCAAVTKVLSRESGPSPAGPITVTLSYQPCEKARSRVLIIDRLPPGMRYIPGSGRWSESAGPAPLNDSTAAEREGKGPSKIDYDFSSTIAGAVTVNVHNLPPQTGGHVSFDVEIVPGLAPGTLVVNKADYTFYDTSNQPFGHETTNIATYLVTGRADFDLLGDRLPTAAPGATITFTNLLTNKGDVTDTYDITLSGSTFPAGSEITLLKSDGTTPLADSNASGVPDTGPVAPGGTYNILVRVKLPENIQPGTYKVVKTGRSANTPTRSIAVDDVVDTISQRCSITLEPDNNAQIGYGQRVTYTHFLTNRGNCEETVTAGAGYLNNDSTGWSSSVVVDNRTAGNGSLPGALDSTDTPVVQGWSHRLAPGESLRLLVEVRAPANEQAAGLASASAKAAKLLITNLTRLVLTGNAGGAMTVRDTTIVDSARVSGQPGQPDNIIQNHTTPSYEAPTLWGIIGSYLYLRADAKICNADAGVAETRRVIITGPNGERELATATETGPNTGIFTVTPFPVRSPPVVQLNGVLEGLPNDTYDVEILDCGRRIMTVVTLKQAASVVFDSVTNAPIAGATVTVVSAAGGQCGKSAVSRDNVPILPVVTGADGRFSFPPLPKGSFCLALVAPNGYSFASRVPWTMLSPDRNLVVTGLTSGASYGDSFDSDGDTSFAIDVPMDPAAQDGLFVQKTASRSVAELGDSLDYTVRVRNGTGNVLDRGEVRLTDDLPLGFAFVAGSARRDGRAIADPVGGRGPRLTLVLGPMKRDEQVVITYRVRVGPGALQGDGVNRVQASYTFNGTSTFSNIATARVQVTGGVFSDKGFILGRVFLDCKANGVLDKAEQGVPGVRLVLEDGSYVVTDGQGKFSFYGITNRTHVVKVDRTTLPAGARLVSTSTRNLGDGGSRIVDLKAGELHRADFAVQGCEPALVEEVTRRAKAAQNGDETTSMIAAQLATEPRIVTDVKSLPASGVVHAAGTGAPGTATQGAFTGIAPAGSTGDRPGLAAPAGEKAGPIAALELLETVMEKLDNKLGFIGLADGDKLATSQATIRVKGNAGGTLKLTVNGVAISDKRVGKRGVLEDKQLLAWEYFGIEMREGENTLSVSQVDQFGNPRGEVSIKVFAPGQLAKLALVFPGGAAVADGKTAAPVTVTLSDSHGMPIAGRTLVTLEASLGRWQGLGQTGENTLQVMVENGRGDYQLVAPLEPGAATVVASTGGLRTEARLDFLPELRQMMATGVIEGIVNMRKLGTTGMVAARASDGFEQELRQLSRDFGRDNQSHAAARAAFYLKGKIKGEYLLTAAYDSDKDSRERLFRDIQPDEFYPIYGDSGVRGFDAQSTSKLYVRVDNKRSYLLWGDFTTQSQSETRKLSNYSRSLTGLRHHYENDRVSVNTFASRDSSRQVIEEVRGNGTSGPYQLNSGGALVNSEKVEIIVRDRNQPALILSTLAQARFADYEIEPLTGRILFKAPVPSLDRDLNPVFVRVTYEVDQGGEQFWVGGIDAQVKLGDRVEIGGIYVKDQNPLLPFTLAGANMTVKLGASTYVIAEAARTEKGGPQDLTGDAARLEIKHESARVKGNAFVARTDVAFDNPGAYLTMGRNEAGGKLDYKLSDKTSIRAEALRSEDALNSSVRSGASVSLQHRLADKLTLEIGVRHAAEKGVVSAVPPVQGPDGIAIPPQPLPEEVTTVRARLTSAVPQVAGAVVYGEVEVDVQDADRRIIAAGGEYQLGSKGRVYARHQFQSSITGPYGLNATERQNVTAIGVDTEYMKEGKVFSEYRIRDVLAGGDTEAALGLKNLWSLAPGLRLGTTFERVQAISGTGQNENTALALALEYTANPDWKASSRLELRDGYSQDSVLFTVGLAAKLSRDWSALLRNTYNLQRTKDAAGAETDRKVDRLQAGIAYRDNDTNKWNVLGRVESRFEEGPASSFATVAAPAVGANPALPATTTEPGANLKSTTHIVSLHADWQPIRPFLVTGRYAAKWVSDKSNGLSSKYNAQAAGVRATWEFSPKWDIGFVSSILIGDGAQSRQYGLGLEVGYLLATNLWVSGGYNFMGYKDPDLAGADYTAKGPYVRLRYKFDESILPQGEGRK